MKLLTRIGRTHGSPFAAPPAPAATTAGAEPGARAGSGPLEPAPPRGCGWYDSSFELQQGLCVQEHLDADTLASQLPLHAWLELQLSGWRGAAPGARACAFTSGH